MNNFSSIIENTDFAGIMLVLDRNFNIERANENFLNLLDYKEIDVFGKQLSDLIVPDEKSIFFDMVYSQDISNNVTLKFYHKSGAFRFFSITLLDFNERKIVFGRSIKKEFLNKKYEYYNEIQSDIGKMFHMIDVENIRDFISFEGNPVSIILDLLPIEFWIKDRYGKYIFGNRRFTDSTDLKMENIYLKDDFQIFSEETAKNFVVSDHLAIDSGKRLSYVFETDGVELNGWAEVTKIPVYNKQGKYIGILGFSTNITQQKVMEMNYKQEQDRMRYLLDNVSGFVFEIDSKGELLFISGDLAKRIGFSIERATDKNMFSVHSGMPEIREKIQLAQNGNRVEMKTKFGDVDVLITMIPVKKEDGTIAIIGNGTEVLHHE
ncbi:MAG: PAS domain-containing protein [Bacilli bacterium]|nr:PAS domain-containing protein [Bacilli bacterium]